jgi:Holliday junction resolvase RusA-like endonuclease
VNPVFSLVVHGSPAPQGSKRHVGKGRLLESSKDRVKSWRELVTGAAVNAITHDDAWVTLDGPLAVALTITVGFQPVNKPTWWAQGVPWRKTLRWRPASAPDLSKLARSTEDALTDAGVWRDDARVVEYRPLAKFFVGDDAPDVLTTGPGAIIHIWRVGAETPPPAKPPATLPLTEQDPS